MAGVVSLLVVLHVALVITRVATVSLRATGLSDEEARFQARSAFSGVGFTTTESEDIVTHPARRRIVLLLMMLSSAGIVSALGSLMLSFARTSGIAQSFARVLVLVLGLVALWAIASSRRVDGALSRLIERALARWTDLDVHDYTRLLGIRDEHAIAEIAVDAGEWLAGRSPADLDIEGVVVLGIQRAGGAYIGAPSSVRIEPGDNVIVYGRSDAFRELNARCAGHAGDRAHQLAAHEHRQIEAAEAAAESERIGRTPSHAHTVRPRRPRRQTDDHHCQ
jgi:hypothetical protein